MSKSLGNVIEPFRVVDLYGADALRFYLLREVGFGSDGEVSPEGFEGRYNSELANEYGNLASRLAMIDRYRDGVVPNARPPRARGRVRRAGRRGLHQPGPGRAHPRAGRDLAADQVPQAATSRRSSPGSCPRTRARPHLDEVLYALAEGLRVVSVLVHPFLPDSAERLLEALGQTDLSLDLARFQAVGGGASIGELEQLFPRVDPRPRPPGHVVDSHCHLDMRHEPADAELVARARAAGSAVSPPWARTDRRLRGRSTRPALTARSSRSWGAIHTRRKGSGREASRRSKPRRPIHGRALSAKRASTTTTTTPAERSAPRLRGSARTRRSREPAGGGDPHEGRGGRHVRGPCLLTLTHAARRDPALLLGARTPGGVREQGYFCSFAGNVTCEKATDLQEAARELPPGCACSWRPTPHLAPQPLRGQAKQAGERDPRPGSSPACAA